MKRILLSIITITALNFGASAQNVNIPDANFKAYLVGNTAINTNADTEIQVSEASAYSGFIQCFSMSISDLTGIESFTSLTVLECQSNPLGTLDVSSNTALTLLNCGSNQLSTLDVSNNTTLTNLSCGANQLTSLDMSNHSVLNRFDGGGNLFTQLNMANGNNTNFAYFYAHNNPNLTCIEVDDVAYSNANWPNIDAASSFSIDCNGCFVSIPDANFKAYLVANTSINTNGNTEIECAEASAFTGQINCPSLSISDLTGIEAFTALAALICNNNSLSSLDVSSNTVLVELKCHYNSITSLDVSNNTALYIFHCYSNSLSSLDVSNNTVLSVLSCSDNSLSSLDVSNNTALTVLSCFDNSLSSLDVSNNTALTVLSCFNNSLSSLDASNNTALTQLDCHANSLISLDVSNGNNTNMTTWGFYTIDNPNLTCIQVDDVTYSTTNWTLIDATTSFSLSCGPILVNSITVDGQGGASTITTAGGTLQMEAAVLPANTDDDTYTWSVANGTGSATISVTGLLTATANGTVTVTATANDASGISGDKTITISNQTAGINDVLAQNFIIYPNPATNQITIDTDEQIETITIFDLFGSFVQQESTATFSIERLSSGIYFANVKTSNGMARIRFMKQ